MVVMRNFQGVYKRETCDSLQWVILVNLNVWFLFFFPFLFTYNLLDNRTFIYIIKRKLYYRLLITFLFKRFIRFTLFDLFLLDTKFKK